MDHSYAGELSFWKHYPGNTGFGYEAEDCPTILTAIVRLPQVSTEMQPAGAIWLSGVFHDFGYTDLRGTTEF